MRERTDQRRDDRPADRSQDRDTCHSGIRDPPPRYQERDRQQQDNRLDRAPGRDCSQDRDRSAPRV